MNFRKTYFSALLLLALAFSCNSGSNTSERENMVEDGDSKSSAEAGEEDSADWEILFDGKNLDHWRSVRSDSFPSRNLQK